MFTHSGDGVSLLQIGDNRGLLNSMIRGVPVCRNFGFVAYSQLLPGTRVSPHVDSTSLRLRFQLGVNVPGSEQIRKRVGEQWRHWQQGGVLASDESYNHEVAHSGHYGK